MGDLRYPHDVGEKTNAITACIQFKEFERTGINISIPKNTITLYMPNDIKNPNVIKWEDASLTEMGMNTAGAAIDFAKELSTNKRFGNVLGRLGQAGGALGKMINSDPAAYFEKKIINPYTIMMFKSVELREFSFEFSFYPRSQSETTTILQIINTLKGGSLPKEDANSGFLSYPNEFEIEFLFNGQPNPFMPKFKRCVITNIDTDYTGQSVWAMTREGSSAETKMNITFKEIEIITQPFYNQGTDVVSSFISSMAPGSEANSNKNNVNDTNLLQGAQDSISILVNDGIDYLKGIF